MSRSKAPLAAALACVLLWSAGCGVSRLQFRNDHRLVIEAPAARHLVKLPLTVRWSVKDFQGVGLDGSSARHKGAFAVFVDRSPMPVGRGLSWLAKDDEGCKRDPRCPDRKYLEDRGVYVTALTSVTIDVLPSVPRGVGDEQHSLNVVLLDGTGHRIGESGWHRTFTYPRRSR